MGWVPESYLLSRLLKSKDQGTEFTMEEVWDKPRMCAAVGFAHVSGVLQKGTATPGPSSAWNGPGRHSEQMLPR